MSSLSHKNGSFHRLSDDTVITIKDDKIHIRQFGKAVSLSYEELKALMVIENGITHVTVY